MKINQFPGYYFLKKKTFFLIRFKPQSNILIFADPRGGSTWLTEIIKEITKLPLLWEPLHVRKMPSLQPLNFSYRQYINETCSESGVNFFFSRLFKGELRDSWLYSQEKNTLKLFKSHAAIIKFCRGNLLLPYLTENFRFKKKPVYLLRHPLAVVASQLKQGGWDKVDSKVDLSKISAYPYDIKNLEFLKKINTKEEVLTVQWCLHNKYVIEHSKNNKNWITITYEEMVMQPEETLARILKSWQIKKDLKYINFQKKSFTSINHEEYKKEERLTKWKTQFNEQQINRMLEILNFFEINLYNTSIMPLTLFNAVGDEE
tara:strand:- start:2084 stop:3034 length:951 start_codon:yes stop_codon:yes gene_type:complete